MRNLNYRVCDLYTWQSFFYLDVLRGASVGFTQGLAMLARDGGGDRILKHPVYRALTPKTVETLNYAVLQDMGPIWDFFSSHKDWY